MKRFLIILLIVCILIVTADIVLAKVSFGGWDKWDEEFPPPKTYWNLTSSSPGFFRYMIFLDTKEPICIVMNRYICRDKKCAEKMSIILFSPKSEKSEDILGGTGDYQFAIAAFPPDKNKMIIRTYEKDGNILKFIQEWQVPYENDYPVLKDIKLFVPKILVGAVPDVRLVVFDSKKFTLLFKFDLEEKETIEYLKKTL